MNVLELLPFGKIKKQVVAEVVAKAKILGYDLEPGEVGIKHSEGFAYWLVMPNVLHCWEIVYHDGMPVDRECATILFMTIQSKRTVLQANRGLFGRPAALAPKPTGYEIVMRDWSLVAVVDPACEVSWGEDAFRYLLSQVLCLDAQSQQVSQGLRRQKEKKVKGIPFSREMILAIQNTEFDRYPPFPIDLTGPFKGVTRRTHKKLYRVGEVRVLRESLVKIEQVAVYEADGDLVRGQDDQPVVWEWKRDRLPSIFMPDFAGREFVEIVKVARSRLGSMGPMDLVYEGLLVTNDWMNEHYPEGWGAKEEEAEYRLRWKRLWESINGRGTCQPDVLVYEYHFKRVREYESGMSVSS